MTQAIRESIDILIILDRSGSMANCAADHIGGLRTFLKEQAEQPGDVRVTFVQFDTVNPCQVICTREQPERVTVDLVPRGGTPLYDAIGLSLAHWEQTLKAADADPDQKVIMIVTDGEENASCKCTHKMVTERLAAAERGGAKVLFLGANLNSPQVLHSLGVADTGGAMTFAMEGVSSMYAATSQNVLHARSAMLVNKGLGMSAPSARAATYQNMNYTSAQRQAAVGGASSARIPAPHSPNIAEITDTTVTITHDPTKEEEGQ